MPCGGDFLGLLRKRIPRRAGGIADNRLDLFRAGKFSISLYN
jgi:hypothetical protein